MQYWDRLNKIAVTGLPSSFSSILKRPQDDVQHRWQSMLCKTTENLLETSPKNPAKNILTRKSNSKIHLETQLEILTR